MNFFNQISQKFSKAFNESHGGIDIALKRQLKKLQNYDELDVIEEANYTLSLLESIIELEFVAALVDETKYFVENILFVYQSISDQNNNEILAEIINKIKYRLEQFLQFKELLFFNKQIYNNKNFDNRENQTRVEQAIDIANNLYGDELLPDQFLYPIAFSFVAFSSIKILSEESYQAIYYLIEAINILDNIPIEKRLVISYTGLLGVSSNRHLKLEEKEKIVQSLLDTAKKLLLKAYNSNLAPAQEYLITKFDKINFYEDNYFISDNVTNICSELREKQNQISNYNQDILVTENDPNLYYRRGKALFELGKYQEAIADFSTTIELNSDYALAYYHRGLIQAKLGNYSGAIPDFEETIRLDFENENAYYNLGKIYAQLGEDEQAIANFNSVIKFNPNNVSAYFNRGLIYHKLGSHREAQNFTDYERAIKDKASYYSPAIAEYQQVFNLDQNNWLAMTKIGLIRYEMGDEEAAIQEWNNALQINNSATEPKFAIDVAQLAVVTRNDKEDNDEYRNKYLEEVRKVVIEDTKWTDLEFLKSKLWGENLRLSLVLLVFSKIQTYED